MPQPRKGRSRNGARLPSGVLRAPEKGGGKGRGTMRAMRAPAHFFLEEPFLAEPFFGAAFLVAFLAAGAFFVVLAAGLAVLAAVVFAGGAVVVMLEHDMSEPAAL